jgi:hypothetical protein
MPRDLPSIRILPMSDKIDGFRGRTIEDVQRDVFLRDLPRRGGRFRYRATGLKAPAGTLVLFQFKARVIASATLIRDEKFDPPRPPHTGALHFDPASIRVFDPVDVDAMRLAWPWFRRFGHVKQNLNPGGHAAFRRQLKHVCSPG